MMRKSILFFQLTPIFIFIAIGVNAASTINSRTISSISESHYLADETEIYASFNEIEELTTYLSTNETGSFDELAATNNTLVINVDSSAAMVINAQEKLTPPIFGPFLWGCCYGPVGIIVVAVCTNSDREQIKQAANGCIVFHVAAAALYGLYYMLIFYAENSL